MRLLAALALLIVQPAWAHHAAREAYDFTDRTVVRGTLSRIDWVNPHIWFEIEEVRPDGGVTRWSFEWHSIAKVRRAGIPGPEYFELGETYVVSFFPARAGGDVGAVISIDTAHQYDLFHSWGGIP